jgi:hypothetical protein
MGRTAATLVQEDESAFVTKCACYNGLRVIFLFHAGMMLMASCFQGEIRRCCVGNPR